VKTFNEEEKMNQLWHSIRFLAVVSLLGTSPVATHDSHTEGVYLAAAENVGPTTQPGSLVAIQTFQFKPAKLEVKAGTVVTWRNQDDIRHTVTSGTPDERNGRYDAPLAGKGTSFSFTFTQPGTYLYFCDRHQHMRGEIQVK
jgi:plastocyanin